MPMTIERAAARRQGWGLRFWVSAVAVTLILWFGGLAALALAIDPIEVVAFGRAGDLIRAAVAADADIVRAGPGFLVLRANTSGWVRRLYAGGAGFVWPLTTVGCRSEARSRRDGAD